MHSFPLRVTLALSLLTLWPLGGCAAQASGPKQSLGTVLWVGDASYVVGTPGIGMRASSTRRVPMVGVRIQLDGMREPLSHSSRTGSALRQLVAGQRVRVTYREESSLFGRDVAVIRIAPEGESH
jgi:hypothetical protein